MDYPTRPSIRKAVGMEESVSLRNHPRLRIGAVHLHQLGSRAVGEFLAELGEHHGIEADVINRLDEWGALTPDLLAAVGGDRWAPFLSVLPGGRR